MKITDDFLIRQAQTVYGSSKSGHDLIMDKMEKNADQYNGEFPAEQKKYSSFLGVPRLFINRTYTSIQRILVDVVDTLFFDPDEIISIKSGKNIPNEKKEAVKSLLNYRLNEHPICFFKELYEGALDAIKLKYCVLKVYPELDIRKRKKTERVIGEDGVPQIVEMDEEEDYIAYYEPHMDAIPPEDVLFGRNATWKDYYKHPIIHTYLKTRDELNKKGFKNIDAIPSVNGEATDEILKIQRNEDIQSPFSSDTNVREAELVRVFEFWDFLPGEDGYLVSGSYIMLGDNGGPIVVGRGWEENELPTKFSHFEQNRPPFILGMAYPEPHSIDGKSFPEITRSNQDELNAVVNQEREAVARALRPITYVNRDMNVDLAALIQRRIGGYVQGDGPAHEAISEIPMSNPLMISQGQRGRVDQDYFEAGIPPNMVGGPTNEDTATGANAQLVNANKKISLVVKCIAYTAFLPAFKFLLRYEQTYNTDEFVKKVLGFTLGWGIADDNYPAREIIQGDFDLSVNLGINKRQQLNAMFLLMDRSVQMNQVTAQMVQMGVVDPQTVKFKNPMMIFEEAMKIMGFKNTNEFDVQAKQPQQQNGPIPGIASQARQLLDSGTPVSNMLPAAPGGLNGA